MLVLCCVQIFMLSCCKRNLYMTEKITRFIKCFTVHKEWTYVYVVIVLLARSVVIQTKGGNPLPGLFADAAKKSTYRIPAFAQKKVRSN